MPRLRKNDCQKVRLSGFISSIGRKRKKADAAYAASAFFLLLIIERVLDFVEEGAALLIVLFAGGLLKAAQQLFLLAGEVLRHLHHHPEHLVAGAPPVDIREALAFEPEGIARLGALLDVVGHVAVRVGTLTSAPSATWAKVRGRSHQMSYPSRSKIGWGRTDT